MQFLFGLGLLLIGITSGGMGIVMMGNGLAVPGLLVIFFGAFLVFNHFFGKNFKGLFKKILGILLIIFGFINLLKGNLIVVDLLFMALGAFLVLKPDKVQEAIDVTKDKIDSLKSTETIKKIENKLSDWEKEYTKPLDRSSTDTDDHIRATNKFWKLIGYLIIPGIFLLFFIISYTR